jgi:hypothetical protein
MIESLKFLSCFRPGKLPLNTRATDVSLFNPRQDLALQLFDRADTSVETLTRKGGEIKFNDIEP